MADGYEHEALSNKYKERDAVESSGSEEESSGDEESSDDDDDE